jgi:hypothetical protein
MITAFGPNTASGSIQHEALDNNDQVRGTVFQGAVRSTLDSIDQFRVTTAGDNADQGRSSGGQVALVTKSGTNTLRGSLCDPIPGQGGTTIPTAKLATFAPGNQENGTRKMGRIPCSWNGRTTVNHSLAGK